MICIDDVLSMFTEHDQAFVRYDLEAAWDDSEPFTIEVGVPSREQLYMKVLEVTVDPVKETVSVARGWS